MLYEEEARRLPPDEQLCAHPAASKSLLPQLPPLQLSTGGYVDVLVSHVEPMSSSDHPQLSDKVLMFLQPLVYERPINYLSARLQEYYNLWLSDDQSTLSTEQMESLKIGDCFATRWEEDGAWYRCVLRGVPDANGDRVDVMFVDYGNCCWLADASELRHLPAPLQLDALPPLCLCATDVNSRADLATWFSQNYQSNTFAMLIERTYPSPTPCHPVVYECRAYTVDEDSHDPAVDWSAKCCRRH